MSQQIYIFSKPDSLSQKYAHKIAVELSVPVITDEKEKIKERLDLLIVVGGDGTVLKAETLFPGIPKLAFCSGRVGFLSAWEASDWIQGLRIFNEKSYTAEKRLKLVSPGLPSVLNEYYLSGSQGKMFEAEVSVDQKPLGVVRGDGLILATPTGSTAHALSCGGPILLPTNQNIIFVPVNPFRLGSRPMVLPETVKIEVTLLTESNLFADGVFIKSLQPQITLSFSKAEQQTQLIFFPDSKDFFNKLTLLR